MELFSISVLIDGKEKELFNIEKRINGNIISTSSLPNFNGWHMTWHPPNEVKNDPINNLVDDKSRLGFKYHLSTNKTKDNVLISQSLGFSRLSLENLRKFKSKDGITDKLKLDIEQSIVISLQFLFGNKNDLIKLFASIDSDQIHSLGHAEGQFSWEAYIFECSNPTIGVIFFKGIRHCMFDPFPLYDNQRKFISRQMLIINKEGSPKYQTLYRIPR